MSEITFLLFWATPFVAPCYSSPQKHTHTARVPNTWVTKPLVMPPTSQSNLRLGPQARRTDKPSHCTLNSSPICFEVWSILSHANSQWSGATGVSEMAARGLSILCTKDRPVISALQVCWAAEYPSPASHRKQGHSVRNNRYYKLGNAVKFHRLSHLILQQSNEVVLSLEPLTTEGTGNLP